MVVGRGEGVCLHPTDGAIGSGAFPHGVSGTIAVVGTCAPAGQGEGVALLEGGPHRAVQGRLGVDVGRAECNLHVAFDGALGAGKEENAGEKNDGKAGKNGTLHCAYLLSI